MVNNKLKNIIVLKGMASNVVQEAIVVLKPNVVLDKNSYIKDGKSQDVKKRTIINEAEYVINSYIKELENYNKEQKFKKINKKYLWLKYINIVLVGYLIISLIL